jgi:hypothetical protein
MVQVERREDELCSAQYLCLAALVEALYKVSNQYDLYGSG